MVGVSITVMAAALSELVYMTVTNNQAAQGGGIFNVTPSLVSLSNTICGR